MSHTLTNVLVHVVFATKNREKSLTAAVRSRLHAYLARVVNDEGGRAYAVNGGLEHVHLLIRLPPTRSLSDLLRRLKGNSSAWLRGELNPHFAWQRGYSAFSVSQSQYERVCGYIQSQEEHHRERTFDDELASLLKRNELEFDEGHYWSARKGAATRAPDEIRGLQGRRVGPRFPGFHPGLMFAAPLARREIRQAMQRGEPLWPAPRAV